MNTIWYKKDGSWSNVTYGYSNPNLLINGDFQVWQNGEDFTITGDEAYHYTADRWCVYASTGQSIKISKIANGIQASGAKTITQRLERPLKSSQKYMISAMIDGDIKSLLITGGTYISNSFLRYQKVGNYEEVDVFLNGITKIEYVKLEIGNVVTVNIPKDYNIEYLNCLYYSEYLERCIYYDNKTYSIPGLTYTVPKRIPSSKIYISSVFDDYSQIQGTFTPVIPNKFGIPFFKYGDGSSVGLGVKTLYFRLFVDAEIY